MLKAEKRVLRRTLTVVGDLFSSLTEDALKNDRDVKLSLYNSLGILLVLVAICTCCGVYFILQPFVKPLLWALLCGSALHPFKQQLALKFRSKIDFLESSERPFSVNILLLPFHIFVKASDTFGDFVISNFTTIVKCLAPVFTMGGLYFYTPRTICTISYSIVEHIYHTLLLILNIFESTIITWSLIISFCVALCSLWGPWYDSILSTASVVTWVAGTAWISNFLPSFSRLPLFITLNLSLFASYLYGYYQRVSENCLAEKEWPSSKSSEKQEKSNGLTSTLYIKHLTAACLFLLAVSIPAVPYFALVLLAIYVIKFLWLRFRDYYKIEYHINNGKHRFNQLYKQRESILFPRTLKHFLKGTRILKLKLLSCVKEYCDSAATTVVILLLVVGGLSFLVFMVYQAYREGVFLVQASGNIINSTILHNPTINKMIPDDWRTKIDSLLNDAYIYTREGIAKMLKSFLKKKGIDSMKSEQLEQEALQLWDRAYQAWVPPFEPSTGPVTVLVTPDAVSMAYQNFVERLRKTPEVFSWDSGLMEENVSTLKIGFDSIWAIIWSNMSLLVNIAVTMFFLVFGGGISIINFIFNWVVFLSALFYLLNSSHEMYKPVEMITQMFPEYGKRLALAIELSCREVLAASMKLSLFYGLWTWLIHSIFMSHLAYTPAVFAAILGMVPVLGTYWACLPAVLDLWLLQGSWLRALGLFIAQIIPTTVVEMTIYNEIKGSGHPYLTGLSVAGGIFWLGMEGAIAGPVILCIVFTVLNMQSHEKNSNFTKTFST